MGDTRRRFLTQMCGLLGAFPYGLGASRERGLAVCRIGFINGDASLTDPFMARLRALGYTDADLFLDSRIVSGPEMRKHATELATGNLELVVAGALPFALEIRRANPAMRMVIATCPGMISNRFAKTLERPGGNVTGIEELPIGLTAKRLTLLKTVAPDISRVALLSTTPGTGGHEAQLADAEQIAPALEISVKAYRATSFPELQAALAAIASDGMNGLANFQGGLSLQYRQMIADFATQYRLPAVYQATMRVELERSQCGRHCPVWLARLEPDVGNRRIHGHRQGITLPGDFDFSQSLLMAGLNRQQHCVELMGRCVFRNEGDRATVRLFGRPPIPFEKPADVPDRDVGSRDCVVQRERTFGRGPR